MARGTEIVLEKSYGLAEFKSRTPVTPATLFAVASLTKPLTGIAARLLAERGVLSLDDPIAKWLPDFPNGAAITVGQLVTHRSGLPHRVTQLSDEQQPQTAESMTGLVSRARRRPPRPARGGSTARRATRSLRACSSWRLESRMQC